MGNNTLFEQLSLELIGKIEIDNSGFYAGHTLALMHVVNDVILSDDYFDMPWEMQKEIIINNFYAVFPYLDNMSATRLPYYANSPETYVEEH